MKLTYFNRQRTGKKINILEHSFSQLLNESLLDVRLKNAPNLDEQLEIKGQGMFADINEVKELLKKQNI